MSLSGRAAQALQCTYRMASRYTKTRGIDILRDPATNQGLAFCIKDRQALGIHGLLPPSVKTPEQQAKKIMQNLRAQPDDLSRYVYLLSLQDRNEKLFYKVITENVEYCMPLIYTPTVGLGCQKYGLTFRRPRGLYITIHDKDHIGLILDNWPAHRIKAIVVTDGERILGLGDLGAYGMGIPVGKLSLYTALAGVKPHQCLPILLDVGTNNEKLLGDPMYIGMRHKRVTGQEYDDFIDTFMRAIVKRYGQKVLIQFEDFGNHNAFRFLEKYRKQYCYFNDDIQGTASVAVAGVIAAMRITKTKISDHKFLFQGAGEASIGIANLLADAMEEEGTPRQEALNKIFMVDSRGLIVKDRPKGGVTGHKEDFAKPMGPIDNLSDAVKAIKPTAIIGAAAVGGVFTKELLQDMAKFNERPIVFALSNPTSKAECTAEEAYKHTDGRCIFASGSPFLPVTLNGKTFYPGQGNNSYIFPGVALAVTAAEIRPIKDSVFLKAAQRLAQMVTEEDLRNGRVYPPLSEIRSVSLEIASYITEDAFKRGTATFFPEPEDKRAFVKGHVYETTYDDFTPDPYDFPETN